MHKFLPLLLLMSPFVANAQHAPVDTCRQLSAVEIRAAAPLHVVNNRLDTSDIRIVAPRSLDDLLEMLPATDIRNRGQQGVQADINLRGGNYNQSMLLLNGINMTDPHTGHYTLDLPLNVDVIGQAGLVAGSPLAHFGLSAFCGMIDLRTQVDDTMASPFTLGVSAGSFGTVGTTLTARQHQQGWHLLQTLSYHRSDGQIHNTDYRVGNLFLQARRDDTGHGQWDLQAGMQMKDYGANAFYSLAYPDQYESVRSLLFSATYSRSFGWGWLQMALYERCHTDRFELFRHDRSTPPSWYTGHNYHLSNVAGAHIKTMVPLSWGTLSWGAELRDEGIVSSQLGSALRDSLRIPYERDEVYFKYGKRRFNMNTFAQYEYIDDQWSLSVGGALNCNSMFHTDWGVDFRVTRHLSRQFSFNAGVGRYLRFPTFTDLYYSSAVQVGNSNLCPEEACCLETGVVWQQGIWRAEAVVLHRQGNNIIDWIRNPDETLWHCANITEVDMTGLELSLHLRPRGALQYIRIDYAWYHVDKRSGDFVSKYALDHLRHNAAFGLGHTLGPVSMAYRAALQRRNGAYTDAEGQLVDYAAIVLLDVSVNYPIRHFLVGLTLNNLLDRHYFDFGGIEQPGFNLCLTIQYKL